MSEVMRDVESYVDAAVWVSESPADLDAKHTYDDWHDKVSEQLVLWPVSIYDPEEGFAGGNELTRRKKANLEKHYSELPPEIAEFIRQTSQTAVEKAFQNIPIIGKDHIYTSDQQRCNVRADFIYLGAKAPLSGNLPINDFEDFYGLLTGTCRQLFTEPSDTGFMTRRIRGDLFHEASQIYSGRNINPIPKAQALHNIEAAHKVIGYKLGLLGRFALGTAKVMDKVLPSKSTWGDVGSAG